MADYKYQIEKQVAEEKLNFNQDRLTGQELLEIFQKFDKLKEENKWFTDRYPDFYKSFEKYYIKVDIEGVVLELLYFIKLCEATSMYDKVGNTYYNAKKVLGLFPYDNEI
jgi:hypothetical protein